jgi:hypothetical protein
MFRRAQCRHARAPLFSSDVGPNKSICQEISIYRSLIGYYDRPNPPKDTEET